jgi:hypothetical protein
MTTYTKWADVKNRIEGRSTENILKAAEFHIKGLEWLIETLLPEDVHWPDNMVRDIIAYAVLDTTKVKFEDHKDALNRIADGAPIEFRGIKIPTEQAMQQAKHLLENYDWLMDQYDVMQAALERAREEQGGANWTDPDQHAEWHKQ